MRATKESLRVEVTAAMNRLGVEAVRKLLSQTEALAAAKQEEMRLLVFERYRDLLATTDAVTQLKQGCVESLKALARLGAALRRATVLGEEGAQNGPPWEEQLVGLQRKEVGWEQMMCLMAVSERVQKELKGWRWRGAAEACGEAKEAARGLREMQEEEGKMGFIEELEQLVDGLERRIVWGFERWLVDVDEEEIGLVGLEMVEDALGAMKMLRIVDEKEAIEMFLKSRVINVRSVLRSAIDALESYDENAEAGNEQIAIVVEHSFSSITQLLISMFSHGEEVTHQRDILQQWRESMRLELNHSLPRLLNLLPSGTFLAQARDVILSHLISSSHQSLWDQFFHESFQPALLTASKNVFNHSLSFIESQIIQTLQEIRDSEDSDPVSSPRASTSPPASPSFGPHHRHARRSSVFWQSMPQIEKRALLPENEDEAKRITSAVGTVADRITAQVKDTLKHAEVLVQTQFSGVSVQLDNLTREQLKGLVREAFVMAMKGAVVLLESQAKSLVQIRSMGVDLETISITSDQIGEAVPQDFAAEDLPLIRQSIFMGRMASRLTSLVDLATSSIAAPGTLDSLRIAMNQAVYSGFHVWMKATSERLAQLYRKGFHSYLSAWKRPEYCALLKQAMGASDPDGVGGEPLPAAVSPHITTVLYQLVQSLQRAQSTDFDDSQLQQTLDEINKNLISVVEDELKAFEKTSVPDIARLQLLLDLRVLFRVLMCVAHQETQMKTSMKRLVQQVESSIDPITLATFTPSLRQRVTVQMERCSLLLGPLLRFHSDTELDTPVSNSSNLSSGDSVAMAPLCSMLPTIPVTLYPFARNHSSRLADSSDNSKLDLLADLELNPGNPVTRMVSRQASADAHTSSWLVNVSGTSLTSLTSKMREATNLGRVLNRFGQ